MTTEGGGCRQTTTRGGVVVGRQLGGGVVVGRQRGGGVRSPKNFGQNRKKGPEIIVKRAVSCCMGLVQNLKKVKKVDLIPPHVVVRRQHPPWSRPTTTPPCGHPTFGMFFSTT